MLPLDTIWFSYFLFLLSLKIKMVVEIHFVGFLKIFSENEPKIENNKILFLVFSIEVKNLILDKMKTR